MDNFFAVCSDRIVTRKWTFEAFMENKKQGTYVHFFLTYFSANIKIFPVIQFMVCFFFFFFYCIRWFCPKEKLGKFYVLFSHSLAS